MNTNKQAMSWVLAANVIWGVSPLFWKLLQEVPADRILIHRALWSAVLLLAVIAKDRSGLMRILTDKKTAIAVLASSLLLAINWHTYLWAIAQGRVLEASLGYFLLPLLNILLGVLFLKEKINRRQRRALAVIAAAVALKVFQLGVFPWIALVLGGSFATYILIRKHSKPCPIGGLFIECCFIVLSALALSLVTDKGGSVSLWGETNTENMFLLASGAVTVVPMIILLRAAPQVSMQCMGLASYLLPTLMWLVAVLAFQEPFVPVDVYCLLAIWTGVLIFFRQGVIKVSGLGPDTARMSPEPDPLLRIDAASAKAV